MDSGKKLTFHTLVSAKQALVYKKTCRQNQLALFDKNWSVNYLLYHEIGKK